MSAVGPGGVFDCTVLVQALANRKGPAFACLRLVDERRVTLYISLPSFDELSEVLRRPKLRRKLPTLTPERSDAFLQDLVDKATSLSEVPSKFAYPRDPKDEPYINLALAAGARYLVTWDRDLLDLMKDETFQQNFPHLTVLDPVAFLRQLSAAQP